MKKITIATLVLISLLILAGCQKGASGKSVEVQGSDTMVNVTQSWAQDFMADNPDIDVVVNGGGSSVGIQGLINGTTNVANSSRNMKDEEKAEAKKKGVNPVETIVGYDGIVVATNKNNKVSKLTIKQVADIFTGKITNWKDVGGKDLPIVLLSRESSSGTYEFFKEHVLNNGDNKGTANFAANTSLLNNSSQIVEQIEGNEKAIGYFGMGYATSSINEIAIAAENGAEYIKPTVENVKSKKYSISRSLQIYSNGEPKGEIKKYVDFILGLKGQSILEKAGFVALSK